MQTRAITSILRTAALALPLFALASRATATIDGVAVTAAAVNLTARAGHVETPDGASWLMWGYAKDGDKAQYPGPTLIVPQGTTVTINLGNELDEPVSIVFPGHVATATGGQAGLLTREAPPAGSVTYTFQAAHPGTYIYHSGTRPELQIEMGLVGAIIVRPTGFNPAAPQAYAHADSRYDREFLFLLSEMDPLIHDTIELHGVAALASQERFTRWRSVYWFINGRNAPDTMLAAFDSNLPNQPYNAFPRMHPGERVLLRVVGGGRQIHPFHTHGNHAQIIARDGRLLESAPGLGADLSHAVFTIQNAPGETVDAIFEWTGKDLGFDAYGTGPDHPHTCSDAACPDTTPVDGRHDGTGAACYDSVTHEYCPDHGKIFPVTLPDIQQVDLGPFYSGSPFLGVAGFLPPSHVSFNPNAGYAFMWHSHTEKELTNFDIFPGGMMTMLIIEAAGVPIP
jgi:FtsP/CotA-like multicopper oxidase with cupredoxin domain